MLVNLGKNLLNYDAFYVSKVFAIAVYFKVVFRGHILAVKFFFTSQFRCAACRQIAEECSFGPLCIRVAAQIRVCLSCRNQIIAM